MRPVDCPRLPFFGFKIDPLRISEAVDALYGWIDSQRRPCRYVVTPNVDHVVLLETNPALREAYADASLVLADGWPLVAVSRLVGKALPERAAGSDLVVELLEAAGKRGGLRVFLLGGDPGVAERAAANIRTRWPKVVVAGTDSPPRGFEEDPSRNEAILAAIRTARADAVFVCLGAPKQELWVHSHRDSIDAPAALCVGAAIDFLAGSRSRAPSWMRAAGLEWLHRLAGEPRRLLPRYAKDAWVFPRLVWREWRRALKER